MMPRRTVKWAEEEIRTVIPEFAGFDIKGYSSNTLEKMANAARVVAVISESLTLTEDLLDHYGSERFRGMIRRLEENEAFALVEYTGNITCNLRDPEVFEKSIDLISMSHSLLDMAQYIRNVSRRTKSADSTEGMLDLVASYASTPEVAGRMAYHLDITSQFPEEIEALIERFSNSRMRNVAAEMSPEVARSIVDTIQLRDSYRTLLDNYDSPEFRRVGKKMGNKLTVSLEKSLAVFTRYARDTEAPRKLVELMDSTPKNLVVAVTDGLVDISQNREKMTLPLLDLYACNRFGELMRGTTLSSQRKIIRQLGRIARLGDEDIFDDFIGLLEEGSKAIDDVVRAAASTGKADKTAACIRFSTYFPKMENSVYREFVDNLAVFSGKVSSLLKTIDHNREYLAEQPGETLVPLIAIMTELPEYRPRFRQLCEVDKINLARAYSIARDNNDDDGRNKLEQFYQGVKGMLDTRPDNLGKWAESIVSDFRKQGELGLLREVEG